MTRSFRRRSAAALALVVLASGGGGDGGDDGSDAAAPAGLADGPVTIVALGDSLTAGEGDESGVGYVGRLTEAVSEAPGRADSTSVNFGVSGWTSTGMVDGQDGAEGQLDAAVAEVEAATGEGRAVIATVLIGLQRHVARLWRHPRGHGALGRGCSRRALPGQPRTHGHRAPGGRSGRVLGLPDDQSQRPVVVDIEQLQGYYPDFSADEAERMSALSGRLREVVEEVAAEHGARTADTEDPAWSDPSLLADDGVHPNGDGYAVLADTFYEVIEPLL